MKPNNNKANVTTQLKDLANELHIRYSDAGIYAHIFTDMVNNHGDTAHTAMRRDEVVDMIASALTIATRTANIRVSNLLAYGTFSSITVLGADGRITDFAIILTERGREFCALVRILPNTHP